MAGKTNRLLGCGESALTISESESHTLTLRRDSMSRASVSIALPTTRSRRDGVIANHGRQVTQ